MVIGTIVTVVGTISMLGAAGAGMDNMLGAAGVGAFGGLLLNVIGAVLMLIGFIIYIVGVGTAAKDESNFKKAMIFLVLGLVCSVVSAFTGTALNGVLSSVLQILAEVFQLVSALLVINGIIVLARKVGNSSVETKGQFTLKLIVCVIILTIIANIISIIANAVAAGVVGGIVGIVAAILSVIRYFVYLSLLAGAKNMFR